MMKKIIKYFVVFVFSVLLHFVVKTQCVISNLNVETGECIEANYYSFTLSFNISGNQNEFFDLYLNGDLYGSYALTELPLTITEFAGSSSGIDTLLVCSNDTENCCADMLIVSPCQCDYYDISSSISSCTEDSLWFDLNFAYVNVSDSFLVGTPGFFLGIYHLNELPVNLGPLPRNTAPYEILISAQNNIFCFESFPVDDEACANCIIDNVIAEAGSCTEDQQFYVTLSFEYMNTGSDGFSVLGNGNDYGNFAYEDSIPVGNGLFMDSLILGPLPGDCETYWEFIVVDNQNDGCEASTGLDTICCEIPACAIYAIQVDSISCNSTESVQFLLNFSYENPNNDFFEIWGDDQFIGYFPLNQLPLWIDGVPVSGEETVLYICINDQENCCSEYVFENIDCSELACSIDSIEYAVDFLDLDSFIVKLNFAYSNPASAQFSLRGNGIDYGDYYYEELPIIVGPYSCHDSLFLEYIVRDLEDPDCTSVLELGIIGCPVGTKDIDRHFSIVVYPDRTNSYLIIEDKDNRFSRAICRIYNTVGQKLISTNLPEAISRVEIPINRLNSGLYFVEIIDGQNRNVYKFFKSAK